MTIDARRLWIGRFLLMVYLSILSLSVFHVHEHGEDFVCQDCISHAQHAGHITDGSVSMGECVLCSFLSASCLVAGVVTLAIMALVLRRDFIGQTVCTVCGTRHTILLRGPPVCL